tara:strand:- start:8235 stop:8768 length:534 start_codon:yes stop_codon:yes gene_type:complete
MKQISIPKNTPIELDMALVNEAYALGKKRYQSNRAVGKLDLLKSRKPKLFLEGEGVCGEFAAATMLSAPSEEWERIRTIQPRKSEDDHGDINVRGNTIDVKTSQYEKAHLLIPLRRLPSMTDFYFLYTGTMGLYTFRGMISKESVRQNLLTFEFKGECIWIPQEALENWESKTLSTV